MKKGWKAYDKGLVCRGKTYEEGKIFEEEKAEMCKCGMHYCDNPADLMYYHDIVDASGNLMEVTEVEDLSHDVISKDDEFSKKYVTTKIKIGKRIGFTEWVRAVIRFCKNAYGDMIIGACSHIASSAKFSCLASSEDFSVVASSGNYSRLSSSGHCSYLVSSAKFSYLASSGHCSRLISSGNYSKLVSSGDCSQLVSSGCRSQLASSGDYSRLASSEDFSVIASSGEHSRLASSGDFSVVAALGTSNVAKATKGSWIVLAEYDAFHRPVCVKARKVDGKRIKANTFYCLKDGKFEIAEVDEWVA